MIVHTEEAWRARSVRMADSMEAELRAVLNKYAGETTLVQVLGTLELLKWGILELTREEE